MFLRENRADARRTSWSGRPRLRRTSFAYYAGTKFASEDARATEDVTNPLQTAPETIRSSTVGFTTMDDLQRIVLVKSIPDPVGKGHLKN
jgi:hypothetical protein